MSVRKAHNSGRNHLRNVIEYYQQIGHEKAQSIIDSITSSYENAGQAASNPMLQQPGLLGPGAFPGGPGQPPPFGFQGGNPGMMPQLPGNFVPPRPPGLPAHIPWPPPGLPFPPPFPPPGMGGSPMQGMPFPPPNMPGMPPANFPFPPPGQSQSPTGPPPMGGQGFMPPGGGHPPGQ